MVSLGIATADRRAIPVSILCNVCVCDRNANRADGSAKEPNRMDHAAPRLLAADEPSPFTVTNDDGSSPFVIVCDHAAKYLPRSLEMLGLAQAECERHIAWDIG